MTQTICLKNDVTRGTARMQMNTCENSQARTAKFSNQFSNLREGISFGAKCPVLQIALLLGSAGMFVEHTIPVFKGVIEFYN